MAFHAVGKINVFLIMKNLIFLVFTVIFLSTGNALYGQEISSAEIDALVSRVLESTPSVGIAVAVVKDGAVIHSKGYGVKSIMNKQAVDEHTLFAIASNSKAFTAAALSILVDEGKLNWEDKVIDHIGEFKMYNDYVTGNFTITDLLTHRSGLGLGASMLFTIIFSQVMIVLSHLLIKSLIGSG